jgi:hypothetical protein
VPIPGSDNQESRHAECVNQPGFWDAAFSAPPDMWGGTEIRTLAVSHHASGDQVMRVITNEGRSLIIFAYSGGHTPQVFAYPNDRSARDTFDAFSETMGREGK